MSDSLQPIPEIFDAVCIMASYTQLLFGNIIRKSASRVHIPAELSYENIEDAHHIAMLAAQAFQNRGECCDIYISPYKVNFSYQHRYLGVCKTILMSWASQNKAKMMIYKHAWTVFFLH